MTKEWIEKLANDIKHEEHGPAEQFAKEQHRQQVLTSKGKLFFDQTIGAIQGDVKELDAALSGDITSQPTTIQVLPNPIQCTIARPRFPQVQATIQYQKDKIILIRQPQKGGSNTAETYVFHVGENDGVSVREAFGEHAKHFNQPTELAKHFMEQLFSVPKKNG